MVLYKRFLEIGCKIFHIIGTMALFGIVISITCGIFTRKVLGSPFTWTEELCALLFITLAFSGACVSTYRKKHIIVDFLCQKFSKKTIRLVTLSSNILIIIFMGVLFVGSVLLQTETYMILSVILDIPRSVFFLPLLLASVYMGLFFIYDTIMILTAGQPEGGIHS